MASVALLSVLARNLLAVSLRDGSAVLLSPPLSPFPLSPPPLSPPPSPLLLSPLPPPPLSFPSPLPSPLPLACREMAVKFNDYFEFPREFDMAPYTAAHLAKVEGRA